MRGLIRHELLVVVYKALNESGIQIPFPQTDIHLRSMPLEDETLE